MAERRLSIEQKKMQLSTAIPKLGAVGYAEWRPAMRAALVVQRAWAVVRDGVDEAEDEELLAKDETALALLMLNVEPLYRPTIDAARSAKDAWDTLHRMHLNQGETRQQQLRMQLATLVKAPNEAMLVYMNRATLPCTAPRLPALVVASVDTWCATAPRSRVRAPMQQ